MFNISFNINEIFIAASALFILGFILSRIVNEIKLPKVTGYILTGIIFGPYALNVFNEQSLLQLDFLPQIALGAIAFILGAGLSFELLGKLGIRLIVLTLFESLGASILVFFILIFFKASFEVALALSAIAAATAPAATIAVIKEYRAHGPLTETAMAVVALDDAVAIILFGLVMTINPGSVSNFGDMVFHSLSLSFLEIAKAVAIGLVLGVSGNILTRFSKESSDNLIILLGIIFLGIGAAMVFKTSTLLTNMILGLTYINVNQKNQEVANYLERILPPLYCSFFVLAGAHLNFGIFTTAGRILIIWCMIFVFARIFGKMLGAYLGGVVCRVPEVIRKYLGLTLAPQAGVAIGLSLLISSTSSLYLYKSIILNVTLMGVAINELFGPFLTKTALFKAKEAAVEQN